MADPKSTTVVLTKEEIELERLNAAYKEVFGEDGKRNSSQQKVWDDLLDQTYARTSLHMPGRDGKIDPYNAALCSGRRDMYLYIEQRLHSKLLPQEQRTQKPKRR